MTELSTGFQSTFDTRVTPLTPEQQSEEARKVLDHFGRAGTTSLFATLARVPEILLAWGNLVAALKSKCALSDRSRELLILRTAHLCHGEYEWKAHLVRGREAGLTDQEIEAVRFGPTAPSWASSDIALLQAVDDLYSNSTITDATWTDVQKCFNTDQLVEIPILVGFYHLNSFITNSLGIQRDE